MIIEGDSRYKIIKLRIIVFWLLFRSKGVWSWRDCFGWIVKFKVYDDNLLFFFLIRLYVYVYA